LSLISAGKLSNTLIILVLLTTVWACQPKSYQPDPSISVEAEILGRGNTYIDNGDYDQAYHLYSQFIEKFPRHPYVDDAAYRVAYLHVLADEANPYFNYQKATVLFQKFIENYPNSRYIIACQNWLFLLRQIHSNTDLPAVSTFTPASADTGTDRLKKELQLLQEENQRLKKSLEELQQAIER